MKVSIKKYPTYYSPFSLIEKLFFWSKDENGNVPDWVDELSDGYYKTKLGMLHEKLALKFQEWQYNRQFKVKIDSWDTWSADHTLAHIILPLLIELKKNKQGAPYVSIMDRPEHLVPKQISLSNVREVELDELDEFHFESWNWVLDEMIFAFNSIVNNTEDDESSMERVTNGLRLFGVYYRSLWT